MLSTLHTATSSMPASHSDVLKALWLPLARLQPQFMLEWAPSSGICAFVQPLPSGSPAISLERKLHGGSASASQSCDVGLAALAHPVCDMGLATLAHTV